MEGEAAAQAEAVELLPVGSVAAATLEAIAERLSRHVSLPCRQRPPLPALELPRLADRNQIDALALLRALEASCEPNHRIVVAVTARDIAIPVFTFVFGLARRGGRVAVVSVVRADPEFYGLPADAVLRDIRTVVEIRHELGHLAGLEHCPDHTCLMSYAGSVERVDARGDRFCADCFRRLPTWLSGGPVRAPAT
jgi:archaemetzincin